MTSHVWISRGVSTVVVGLFAVVSGCAGGIEAFRPPPDESYDPAVVSLGRELFLRNCSSCHSRDGGGGVGPNLRQVWERLTPTEHIMVVTEGRRRMPSFGRNLDSSDIKAIVAFERTGWSDPDPG